MRLIAANYINSMSSANTPVMAMLAPAYLAWATSEEDLIKLYQENRPYAIVSPELFNQLGWDLPDGGAGHFVACVRAIKGESPQTAIEALTPDFQGLQAAVETVVDEVEDGVSGQLDASADWRTGNTRLIHVWGAITASMLASA